MEEMMAPPVGEVQSLSSLIGEGAVEGEGDAPAAPVKTKKELYEERIKEFERALSAKVIDVKGLRKLAMGGIPEAKPGDAFSLRARTWKILLGHLPKDTSDWGEVQAKKRKQYAEFCEEFLLDPTKVTASADNDGDALARNREGSLSTSQVDDDPLSTKSDSVWNKYFADNEVKDQIARDVARTHPDIHFFNNQDGSSLEHKQCMKRTLFVFAKLNPGLAYVQGMNELHAPLLWTFKTDPDKAESEHAEADAFFCFMEIMSEFRDHFCKQLDNSSSGIRATMTRLLEYLQICDWELWDHLVNRMNIDPQYFAFRWITLMCSQEFHFPDLIRLWDTFLADPKGRLESLLRFCVAMLVSARDMLLAGDFASNLKLLQSYPPTDVNILLNKAEQLQSELS
ncbi:Rab-GTPase-TBC domain-containing protein [Chloropicon primus]|uniref:Rab-GTPase-TBC domain-containing protein n=2 Tax=Chloropicon primus TaxID=1764295 RepID=A0A5B8MH81_9CHLO|nr:Rab-GTPase-TBC domain-containing protein [Chloropicon primus]UPQ99016.1 Rab-GTPase-TBC domain-containing protein [Chloropicon primus]|eukprot:QDZ19806.1 Rab-GTPase-TBC domain-containing protein [Chloropicon primus]